MRVRLAGTLFAVVALLSGIVTLPAQAAQTQGGGGGQSGNEESAAPGQEKRGLKQGPTVLPGLSRPARDLPSASPGSGRPSDEGLGYFTAPAGGPDANQPDPVLQSAAGAAFDAPDSLSLPIENFAGQQSGFGPPDTVGDVGPNDYVQMINTHFQIWDKQGNSRGPSALISSLWAGGPDETQCDTQDAGDPIVLYDQQADRWMLSQFTTPRTAPFFMCIAYSTSGDPTGTYFTYEFQVPASHDYMKYGIWPDGLYMSTWEGGSLGVYVFDRSAMISGSPATFQYEISLPGGGGRGLRILPSDWDGANPPPAGAPNYFVQARDVDVHGGGGADRLELFEFHVDWVNAANSTFTGPLNLPVAAFSIDLACTDDDGDGASRNCIDQPGTTHRIDDIANRLMHRLQYRNFGTHESMVVNQTVDAGNDRAGIRWYELRRPAAPAPVWGVHQQGTYAPGQTAERWMGSAAMDVRGNIAIGYSHVDPAPAPNSLNPSISYVGRQASAPLGSLPEPERLLFQGAGVRTVGTSDRWGDYSSLNVDPVDDCTFWYTQMHGANSQTRIGSFRFADCATDLRITKTVSPPHPNAGEEIVYTITVHNDGGLAASGVVVTDVLPPQVGYLANTDTCTGVAVGSSGTLTCPLGTIPAGQSKSFEIKVKVNADLGGPTSITNTASVTSDQGDANSTNDTISLTHLVNDLADVRTTKFCKPDTHPAPAGTTGTCTIFVTNDGPSAARPVTLTDTHVSDGSFTLGTPTTTAGTCGVAGGTVTCSLGTIQPGATVTVSVPVSSDDGVDVNDVARATSATTDPSPSNNQSTAGLSFSASADLSITKTGPASAVAGTQFTYTVGVDNAGPSTAKDVVVTDELPSGVEFVSAVADVGTFTAVGGTVTWTVGNVAPGDPVREIDITVKVLPQATGQLVNTAVVTSSTSDPDAANNRVTFTTAVSAEAGLTVTKTDSPDPVVAGANLTYTITVGNSGPSTAQDVVLTDTLPAGVTLVSAVDGTGSIACAEIAPGIVSCDIGDLDPGETATIFITVKVGASTPNNTLLSNTAVVSSPTDPDGAQATATTTVVTSAELWIEKSGFRPAGNPSGALVYRITVHNVAGSAPDDTPTSGAGGPSDAQNVVVVDTLPLNAKKMIVQLLPPSCTYDPGPHKVTCTTSTLPAGTSVTYEFQVQVKGSVGTLTNRATVSSSTPDPVLSNNTDTVNNVVQGSTGKGPKP